MDPGNDGSHSCWSKCVYRLIAGCVRVSSVLEPGSDMKCGSSECIPNRTDFWAPCRGGNHKESRRGSKKPCVFPRSRLRFTLKAGFQKSVRVRMYSRSHFGRRKTCLAVAVCASWPFQPARHPCILHVESNSDCWHESDRAQWDFAGRFVSFDGFLWERGASASPP